MSFVLKEVFITTPQGEKLVIEPTNDMFELLEKKGVFAKKSSTTQVIKGSEEVIFELLKRQHGITHETWNSIKNYAMSKYKLVNYMRWVQAVITCLTQNVNDEVEELGDDDFLGQFDNTKVGKKQQADSKTLVEKLEAETE